MEECDTSSGTLLGRYEAGSMDDEKPASRPVDEEKEDVWVVLVSIVGSR
jgi:hypothetical protein